MMLQRPKARTKRALTYWKLVLAKLDRSAGMTAGWFLCAQEHQLWGLNCFNMNFADLQRAYLRLEAAAVVPDAMWRALLQRQPTRVNWSPHSSCPPNGQWLRHLEGSSARTLTMCMRPCLCRHKLVDRHYLAIRLPIWAAAAPLGNCSAKIARQGHPLAALPAGTTWSLQSTWQCQAVAMGSTMGHTIALERLLGHQCCRILHQVASSSRPIRSSPERSLIRSVGKDPAAGAAAGNTARRPRPLHDQLCCCSGVSPSRLQFLLACTSCSKVRQQQVWGFLLRSALTAAGL